jgi:hypothetical protein
LNTHIGGYLSAGEEEVDGLLVVGGVGLERERKGGEGSGRKREGGKKGGGEGGRKGERGGGGERERNGRRMELRG